ncbi:MAG TPA: RT0821/Lpp0805 family surface protein [Steroidobacteraceae bacterium]|jgi:hypothetical protein|nr:RT0821/Lpp0805 family surface protein [Steroidobacteraceae bacterium]
MRFAGVQYLLVFAMLAVCAPTLEAQTNLRWLKDAPAGRFNQKDWSLLQAAIRESLAQNGESAPQTWRNEENGHSGTVTTLKKYTADGKDCRQLQIDNEADGRKGSSRYKACQDPDGVWRETSSGAPLTEMFPG